MNSLEYRNEVESIATNLMDEALSQCDNDSEEAMELINDSLLHETIDGHQWVIYYSYNADVIKYSDNPDGYQEIYDNESLGVIVSDQGVDTLLTVIAYWALYNDVQQALFEIQEQLAA